MKYTHRKSLPGTRRPPLQSIVAMATLWLAGDRRVANSGILAMVNNTTGYVDDRETLLHFAVPPPW
jgi:hypothetical protein